MRWLPTLALAACLCAGHVSAWDYEVSANNELSQAPGPAAARRPRPLPSHSNEVPGSYPSRNGSQSASAAWNSDHVTHSLNEVPDAGTRNPYAVPRRSPNEVPRRSPNEITGRSPNEAGRRSPNDVRTRNPDVSRDPNEVGRRNPNEVGRRNPNEVGRRNPNEASRRNPNDVIRRNPNDIGRRNPGDVTGKRKGRKGEGAGRRGNGTRGMNGTRYFCPPSFVRSGNSCYLLSTLMATWQEAHFHCKDLDAELARMEQRWEDRNMRVYLSRPELAPLERWIGGIYDWELKQWVWGASANVLGYQGFSRRRAQADHRWHCIVMNPTLLFRWSARSCLERRHFLCETPLGEVPGELRRRRKEKLAQAKGRSEGKNRGRTRERSQPRASD